MAFSLLQSVGIPALIGVLAAMFAIPASWMIAGELSLQAGQRSGGVRGRVLLGLCLSGLAMPPYLTYAGWSIVRAPGTAVGDWLGHAPVWVNFGATQAIAVLGLALWAYPLAVLILVPACRAIDRSELEGLLLDGASVRQRAIFLLRRILPGCVIAATIAALTMIGSAVPLHLAQFDTFSVALWTRLMLEPSWSSVVSVWPVGVVAILAAVGLTRRAVSALKVSRGAADAGGVAVGGPVPRATTPRRRVVLAPAALVFCGATLVPLALFASILPSGGLAQATLLRAQSAIINSVLTGCQVGAACLVIALGVSLLLHATGSRARRKSDWRRLAALCTLFLLGAGSLLPGVWVGMALRLSADSVGRWFGVLPDDSVLLVLCHTIRFGVGPVLAAFWLYCTQSGSTRDSMAGEAGSLWTKYWMLASHRELPVLAAAAVAAGVMSLHEIESAVILQPPGKGTLAQRVLDQLHYNRDQDLAVLAVVLIGGSLVLVAVGGWFAGRASGSSGR